MTSKRKTVIPFFYLSLLASQSHVIKRLKNFFFRKSKRGRILIRCGRYHVKVIQSGENAFLGDPGYPCDHAALEIRIGLECGVKKTAEKADSLIPAAGEPCFLHRRVILVKDNDHTLVIIALQETRHLMHRSHSNAARHSNFYIFIIRFLIVTQTVCTQQISVILI